MTDSIVPSPMPSGKPVSTAIESNDREVQRYPSREYRHDESTYTLAGAPLLARFGVIMGFSWTDHLNVWPDDESPKNLSAELSIYANVNIGKRFNLGIDYTYEGYHGNSRPSNTSPMPPDGAWYLVERENSHKLAIHPAINIWNYENKERTLTVGGTGNDDFELVDNGPSITGAIKIGGLMGVDIVDFTSDDPHGYPATEAILPFAGVSVGSVWDFWLSKHLGVNIGLESRYTHSFSGDGHISKPSITFLSLGMGLSVR